MCLYFMLCWRKPCIGDRLQFEHSQLELLLSIREQYNFRLLFFDCVTDLEMKCTILIS